MPSPHFEKSGYAPVSWLVFSCSLQQDLILNVLTLASHILHALYSLDLKKAFTYQDTSLNTSNIMMRAVCESQCRRRNYAVVHCTLGSNIDDIGGVAMSNLVADLNSLHQRFDEDGPFSTTLNKYEEPRGWVYGSLTINPLLSRGYMFPILFLKS